MDNIQKFINEIQELQQAKELLHKVYLEIGPYQDGEVNSKTWIEVRNFFKFDDSE